MSHQLEYRKVNDTLVPIYYKFSSVSTKYNLTSNKYMTVEHWMHITGELDPLLTSGNEASSSKKSKSFDIDSGRLNVKAKWVKLSESELGDHILKILDLNPSEVGKHFLKIEVKLNSNFQRMLTDLEQKNKSLEVKHKSKDTNHDLHRRSKSKETHQDVHGSAKSKKITVRKISDMLPILKKDEHDSSALLNDSVVCNGLDDLNADDLNKHEEYIPYSVPASTSLMETHIAYSPQKIVAQIEKNQIGSEYLPTFVNPGTSMQDIATYEPATATYQPATATYQPATATYEPATATYEPATATYEPAAATSSTDSTTNYNEEKYSAQMESESKYSPRYSPPFASEEEKKNSNRIKYEPTPFNLLPAHNPKIHLARIEINQNKSPTYTSPDRSPERNVYEPRTRRNKSKETDKIKKKSDRKNRSRELFGSSDESLHGDSDLLEKVSSSSHKSKRKKDSSSKRENKSSKESSKSKKKRFHNSQSSHDSSDQVGDISMRNLMNESIDDILGTYPEHEKLLTELYEKHVTQVKRNYKSKDVPDMMALDIVTSNQFQTMLDFLEQKLVQDAEKEHNYSDIFFDLLIPEWALGIFCNKFHLSREDALDTLKKQNVALSNVSHL